jgi:hypothetical protein
LYDPVLMRREEALFATSSLSAVLQNRQKEMEKRALALHPTRVLGVSLAELVAELVTDFRVEPIVLDLEGVTAQDAEIRIPVGHSYSGEPIYRPGIAITYYVPFEGEDDLYNLRPSTFSSGGPPRGAVRDVHVEMTFESADAASGSVKAEFAAARDAIKRWVDFQRPEVEAFNAALLGWAEGAVQLRIDNVRANQQLVSSLGVPIRRRADAPTTYPAPEIRRRPSVRSVRPSSAPASPPEPVLLNAMYEHILEVIKNTARVIELSPSAFRKMREEDLRSHFLVQLNGHYEGLATGETFNFEGRTDILVKDHGKNVFVAECKFWDGPQVLNDTIDQLLGYTSWRDTKTAILLFNRKRALTTVLAKIAPTVAAHVAFVREVDFGDETSFRFTLKHRDDPDRHLTLTVLVFELPV